MNNGQLLFFALIIGAVLGYLLAAFVGTGHYMECQDNLDACKDSIFQYNLSLNEMADEIIECDRNKFELQVQLRDCSEGNIRLQELLQNCTEQTCLNVTRYSFGCDDIILDSRIKNNYTMYKCFWDLRERYYPYGRYFTPCAACALKLSNWKEMCACCKLIGMGTVSAYEDEDIFRNWWYKYED